MANNNNNNKNPFGDLPQEESPWSDELVTTGHSPFNPFTSPQEGSAFLTSTDNNTGHYSPSDLSTNDLIDLQQGTSPQTPAQVASSSRRQKPQLNNMPTDPNVSTAHFTHEGNSKQKGK